jgi:hypothetical protein
METIRRHSFSNFGALDSPLTIALLICLVAALSYFGPTLEWALMLHPQTVWPLWPSCALLVECWCWCHGESGRYLFQYPLQV